MSTKSITVAYGDGIGPEIMEATLSILRYAGAKINIETIEAGKNMYEKGFSSGIPNSAWDSIENTKVLLKSPITTPQGGGYKSLNVTMRKRLGLFANVRPCISYHPFVATKHPNLNVVIVRENEEDLYSGIEYRQTSNMYKCLKIITRTGCERIIRYAFEYAVKNNRKKVTCFSKDNIMKMTDGIFHKVFDEIGKEYPSIQKDHYIIDIGSARLACKPEIFDVIVTSNLYGDIISDIAAEISGSVGLAGSANIGTNYAMFEAIHGSAPDISGQNIANPSGLLNAAIMMLIHIGQPDIAEKIHNAWLTTLEDGLHTTDIYNPETSKAKLGTKEFAEKVIERLGRTPKKMTPVVYTSSDTNKNTSAEKPISITYAKNKTLCGVDVYFDHPTNNIKDFAEKLNDLTKGNLKLQVISIKGLAVWPNGEQPETEGDNIRARFIASNNEKIATHQEIIDLLSEITHSKLDFVSTENLYLFDGELGFSLGQGE